MIQLIENIEDGVDKAFYFLGKRAPEIAITAAELAHTLPLSNDYPCLIDFYITYYKKFSENRILPTLTYHFCSKQTAKCLVYSKTNKMSGGIYGRWNLVEGGITLGDFQITQQSLDRQRAIIETDGFGDTLRACLENKEPFLIHTEAIRDSMGETQRHQTIVSLADAKSVVYYKKNMELYYKKNMELMNKMNVDELMNLVKDSSPQGHRAKVSSVWSERVIKSIKKKIEDEMIENEILRV